MRSTSATSKRCSALVLCVAWVWVAVAHANDASVLNDVEREAPRAREIARKLWDWSELGYLEEKSTALLQRELREAGFAVEAGVAGLPTAFVASAGRGHPVIAILAEFDALPGFSQAAVPLREERPGKAAAHACGHNLFAGGSVAAAVAVARWLERTGTDGTVRLIGTPAEEGGSAKVYMVRSGLFADVDVALHWHPSDRTDASPLSNLANKSAKFRFRGVASHAALAPERGRSALDGVEAMNYMVNLLREHVPTDARIHYVITHGGAAPNVVPDFAEVFYYVRHPQPAELLKIWDRVLDAAQGAARGTGTRLEHEVIHGNYSLLPNLTLARRMHAHATHLTHAAQLGGASWSEEEWSFARALRNSFPADAPPLDDAVQVQPFEPKTRMSSTDVGDVSWTVPTTGLWMATWPPGTASHSWQSAAASGTTLAEAGMMVAARSLALMSVDLFSEPELVRAAREEFDQARGPDHRYVPMLGDRDPPLDYRR